MKKMLRSLGSLTYLEFQEKYPYFRISCNWWEEIRCVYAKWLELFDEITCDMMEFYILGKQNALIMDIIGEEAWRENFEDACASLWNKEEEGEAGTTAGNSPCMVCL